MAIVSYITIIGWLISLFSYKDQKKDTLVSYHLRQAFGLFLTMFCISILVNILIVILAAASVKVVVIILASISYIINIAYLVLLIVGILTANKGEEKPLPIIGKMFEGKFYFIP